MVPSSRLSHVLSSVYYLLGRFLDISFYQFMQDRIWDDAMFILSA
jgi:hypothetical protein